MSFDLVEFKVNLTTNVFNFTGGPFGEETYQFLQLHFHWGSNSKKGSEHMIKGKRWKNHFNSHKSFNGQK